MRQMKNQYLFGEAMFVDDNSMDRLLTATMLKRTAIAEQIRDFSSVFAALTWLRSLKRRGGPFPPVIFLDLNLPVMDGFDFLEHFMAFPAELQMQTSIIVVSATTSAEEVIRIREYPAVKRFFTKPLSAEKLNEIRRLLEVKV